METFKKTQLWTSSLKRSTPGDLNEEQTRSISMKLLEALDLGVKRAEILNDD